MRRLFSIRQKRILAWAAGGRCGICRKQLSGSFHADHIVSFSKGGQTVTGNGQALCQNCNLQKGSK